MSRLIHSLVFALAVSLGAGSLAAAEPVRAAGETRTADVKTGDKRLQRRHRRDSHRRHYRDRRHTWRHRRSQHYRGYYHRGHRYRGSRCWLERRHSRYHGRPAVVSVRVCRDRHGRPHIDRGSRRLVYYLAPHHRRHRRW